MSTAFALACVATLLATAVLVVGSARRPMATPLVYGACLAVSLALLATALGHLSGGPGQSDGLVLPLGLPWIGAHFRIDALSAFFLAVINLGAAGASLYGLGYGRHEAAPERVLAFFPAFLAGMNLVLLADDAFTFLLSWETMSLASWALVMAHHRDAGQRPRRLHLSDHGELRHARSSPRFRPARRPDRTLRLQRHPRGRHRPRPRPRLPGADPPGDRRRFEGGPGAAACLAAARPSRRAQPRLGADERRHDQGRGLRLHPRRFRPGRNARMVVEPRPVGARRRHRRHRHPLCHAADRPEETPRLQHGREYRRDLRRPRPCACLQERAA